MTKASVFGVAALNTLSAFWSHFDRAVTPRHPGFSRGFGCLAPCIIPFSWQGGLHASCCKNRGSRWEMMPPAGHFLTSTGWRAEWHNRWSPSGP